MTSVSEILAEALAEVRDSDQLLFPDEEVEESSSSSPPSNSSTRVIHLDPSIAAAFGTRPPSPAVLAGASTFVGKEIMGVQASDDGGLDVTVREESQGLVPTVSSLIESIKEAGTSSHIEPATIHIHGALPSQGFSSSMYKAGSMEEATQAELERRDEVTRAINLEETRDRGAADAKTEEDCRLSLCLIL
jgi:hypothetical protein